MGLDGEEILNGATKTYADGTVCMCQLPEDFYSGSFDLMATCTEPAPKSCEWQGKVYEGSFQPGPCTFCECVDGNALCYIQDCMRPPCLNPKQVAGRCCPVCPDGENSSEK